MQSGTSIDRLRGGEDCDNEALWEAASTERPVLCVYVHEQESTGIRPLGGATLWWLHGALKDLNATLAGLGNGLTIFCGKAIDLIPRIAQECGASAVFWNRRYGAAQRRIDAEIKATLRGQGKTAKSFRGNLINEPWTLQTTEGGPFRVFSAYWRAARTIGTPPYPLPPPRRLEPHRGAKGSAVARVELDELGLEVSQPDWASGLRQSWTRGETGAQGTLGRFLESSFNTYATARDRPDRSASTSRKTSRCYLNG
ncbi:deoxyribodipyrimidine photo-lyase [Sinorhizobium sp. GL28]|uniref:deoxyribodipyrimidine photo-lyase n=1 Tax=Sinorhizobium sp. GL28 TaxID=1358418 RepID=UPI0013AFF17F